MRKLNNHDVHKRYQDRLEEDVEFTINYELPLSCLWSTIKDFSSDFEEKTEAFFIFFQRAAAQRSSETATRRANYRAYARRMGTNI